MDDQILIRLWETAIKTGEWMLLKNYLIGIALLATDTNLQQKALFLSDIATIHHNRVWAANLKRCQYESQIKVNQS